MSLQENITKVVEGFSDMEIVGYIDEDISRKTHFKSSVVFKKKFFEKLQTKHPEFTIGDIKMLVGVLNDPDEVFYIEKEDKLKYFKKLDEGFYGLLSLRDDVETENTSPATYIKTSDRRYIERQKSVGIMLYKR